MFHRFRRLFRQVPAAPPLPALDPDWALIAVTGVTAEVRSSVDSLCDLYAPLRRAEPVELSFDEDLGSLRVLLAGLPPLVLATGDSAAARELDAAFRLGGLTVSTRRAGVGLLEVSGIWEGLCYRVVGIPAGGIA